MVFSAAWWEGEGEGGLRTAATRRGAKGRGLGREGSGGSRSQRGARAAPARHSGAAILPHSLPGLGSALFMPSLC